MNNFNVDYYINEEKKVVVAKLTNCFNGVACDMCHKGWPGHEAFVINDEFVGKAKCSDEDVFDIEKGKKIAFKRAYKKFTMAKLKTIKKFQDANNAMMKDLNKTIDDLCESYINTCTRRDNEINQIIEE